MLHQVARFASVVPLIEAAGPGEVLDVGSGSEGVAGWLGPEWRVTALDRSFAVAGAMRGPSGGAARTVVGDARKLPFADDSFDVVLALDVLEHIRPADRGRALSELVRTARRRLIVACPTGPAALAADRRLAGRLRARGMDPPDWLLEHEANGFPQRDDLLRWLGGRGQIQVIANENIRWHTLLFSFESRRPGFHLSRTVARMLAGGLASRGLARTLSRLGVRAVQGPDRPPRYRTVVVLDLVGDPGSR
jgi:SAM-dependent methyltransferase